VTAPTHAAPAAPAARRDPGWAGWLRGCLGAEWLKLRRRYSTWILGVILILYVGPLEYLVPFAIAKADPKGFRGISISAFLSMLYPAHLVPYVFQSLSVSIGAALMVILGALTASGEYDWHTLRTLLTMAPGRLTNLAAKLIVMGAVTLVLGALVLVDAALCSLLVASIQGNAGGWPAAGDLLRGFLAVWLTLGMWMGFGFVLGTLLRQAGLAIGIGLVYALVLESVLTVLPRSGVVLDLRRSLPGGNATALGQSFGSLPGVSSLTTPLGVSGGQAALVLAGWLLAFLALSALVFRRRDVTG